MRPSLSGWAVLSVLVVACGTNAPPTAAPTSQAPPPAPQPPPPPQTGSVTDPPLRTIVGGTTLVAPNAKADSIALGSFAKPVAANGPNGQREYLMRLQCADKSAPAFARNGSSGSGSDGHIIDVYSVTCKADGTQYRVYMDMYHNTREMIAVPHFTILPDLPAKMATGCPPAITANADSNAKYVFTYMELATPTTLLTPLPNPLTGYGVTGSQQVSFILDTLGVIEPGSITAGVLNAPDRFDAAKKLLATLKFSPPEHHPGCKVRQRYGMTFSFR